ncbi:hypothetical protein [Tahibacter amnicola]|uniref:Uncharacterized protein n=1 Tax=Tahibacter amnicola TaxID=2976241 RepID=A0ABY6BCW5_9GAMM|nr:hypothetical protein [Tahibacter amnicola]UXI67883.1 hypothetical protein N4264_24650 [Tahibacter amnicola]
MGEHRPHSRGRANVRADDNRRRIAVEAARLISELGLRDYHQAKLRAAERLGIHDERALPRNTEIEDALREYQRLFGGQARIDHLDALRRCAVEAMRFFHTFQPRLVGAVLEGTADEHSAVCLHLFSDDPDALSHFLIDQNIPFEQIDRVLRWERDEPESFAAYRFQADDIPVDLTLLPLDALRQAPLDRIDGKPMRRANVTGVQQLLGESASDS